jgi:hypothetical protein
MLSCCLNRLVFDIPFKKSVQVSDTMNEMFDMLIIGGLCAGRGRCGGNLDDGERWYTRENELLSDLDAT